MTLVRGRGRPRQECPSIAPSVAPSVAPLDSSPLPESVDELSNQLAGPSGTKSSIVDALVTATNVPKYSENNL